MLNHASPGSIHLGSEPSVLQAAERSWWLLGGLYSQGYVSITEWELVTEQVLCLHVHTCVGEVAVPLSVAWLCQNMHAPKLQSL